MLLFEMLPLIVGLMAFLLASLLGAVAFIEHARDVQRTEYNTDNETLFG